MVNLKNEETEAEVTRLMEMREYYEEFSDKQKGSCEVREFLANAFKDDALLLRYLIGRKYRPKHAWETIRSYAEVRFDKYPEMFPATLPPKDFLFRDNEPIFGILKGRDSKGRRIVYFKLNGWDMKKFSLDELIMLTVPIVEKALWDDDCLKNGLVFVHDCSGASFTHARHYTMSIMLRVINIYWFSFPLMFKGAYYVKIPSFLTYIYAMMKPFLPKKLKERILILTPNQGLTDLHERLPPNILPKFLGGNLETNEAVDHQFFEF
ncbi:unnamed protein product [Orchesella dallaii]|uniref:CRAL-TRIO domain-containing protein n=1 Tax=Orchesella dallaii TaxID=48710 RepID=A0ABP1R5D0_9HEXA